MSVPEGSIIVSPLIIIWISRSVSVTFMPTDSTSSILKLCRLMVPIPVAWAANTWLPGENKAISPAFSVEVVMSILSGWRSALAGMVMVAKVVISAGFFIVDVQISQLTGYSEIVEVSTAISYSFAGSRYICGDTAQSSESENRE